MSSPPDLDALDDVLDAAAVAGQPLKPLAASQKNSSNSIWRNVVLDILHWLLWIHVCHNPLIYG